MTADSLYFYVETSTNVYYVSSLTGSNSNNGGKLTPWATLKYALSQAGTGDLIILRAGHTETISTQIQISNRCFVFGEGQGNSRPTFASNLTGNDAIQVTSDAVIRGIRIIEGLQSTTGVALNASSGQGCRLLYCDFVCGPNDQATKVTMNTTASFMHSCTFSSTATSSATRPVRGLSGAQWVFDTTFTAGSYGWQNTNSFNYGWGNEASGPVGIGGSTSTSVIQCDISGGAYFDCTSNPDYRIFPEGMGLVGHPLISGRGLFVSGFVKYVDSTKGTDLTASGASKQLPYATLKYAINTAAVAGLYVVGAGHTETVTSAAIIAAAAGMIIVGEGTGDNRPAITRGYGGPAFTANSTSPVGVMNIRWLASSVASGGFAKTRAYRAGTVWHQCTFEQGALDTASGSNGLSLAYSGSTYGQDALVWGCDFKSVVTSTAALPDTGLHGQDADNVHVMDCTFDGGAYGWTNGEGFQLGFGSVLAENITLVRGTMCAFRSYAYQLYLNALLQVSSATGGSGVLIDIT